MTNIDRSPELHRDRGAALRTELTEYLAQHPYAHDAGAQLRPGRFPGTKGDPRGLDYDRPFDIESVKR